MDPTTWDPEDGARLLDAIERLHIARSTDGVRQTWERLAGAADTREDAKFLPRLRWALAAGLRAAGHRAGKQPETQLAQLNVEDRQAALGETDRILFGPARLVA